ncbi:hypothetical protein ACQKMN_19300 [Ureibacillus composti]
MNQEDKKKIIEAIVNSDDHYKNNDEEVKRLEKSLDEVEAIQKGDLPEKSGRELLNELRAEKRKKRIKESFRKAVEQNGEALKRLDD